MTDDSQVQLTNYATLLAQRVRVLQIVTFALIAGILVFFGVAMALRRPPPAAVGAPPAAAPPAQPPAMFLSLIAFAMLAGGAVGAVIIPAVMSRAQRNQTPLGAGVPETSPGQQALEPLLQAYQSQHIMRAALIEGPAFMGLVAYMTEGHAWALIVPVASLAGLVAIVPTMNRALRWMGKET